MLYPLVLCPWFSAKSKTVCIHTPLETSVSSFMSEGGHEFCFFWSTMLNTKLPHDKTNKRICVPSKDSDQLGHLPSLIRVFSVRMKKSWILSYPLRAQRRLWSDWAAAQANLSLCWAQSSFYWFCHAAAQIMMLLIVLTCTIVSEFGGQMLYFHCLRRSPQLFLKKSGLRCTYDPLFIQTGNSNFCWILLILWGITETNMKNHW